MFSPEPGPGEQREIDQTAHEEALGVMGVFIILTVMMVSQVYKYIQNSSHDAIDCMSIISQ